jgi:hypothetical protein
MGTLIFPPHAFRLLGISFGPDFGLKALLIRLVILLKRLAYDLAHKWISKALISNRDGISNFRPHSAAQYFRAFEMLLNALEVTNVCEPSEGLPFHNSKNVKLYKCSRSAERLSQEGLKYGSVFNDTQNPQNLEGGVKSKGSEESSDV